ncbi:MAG: DUF4352 domain-containing protein [Candidatus Bathyarchaeota archaeon]|nr:DUF4352 domain-containing protein [Candidatus Bathyarchaeota archaeon]
MSPVIATVILVAVAITVSVAVAYWMGGIAGQYTKFEKVEIQSAIVTKPPTGSGNWTIQLKVKNTGTATATLISAFVNNIEVSPYDITFALAGQIATNQTTSTSITSGGSFVINVYINNYSTLSSGTTVNIKLHSAGGMDYIKLVELI